MRVILSALLVCITTVMYSQAEQWNTLLQKHVKDGWVDYNGFKSDEKKLDVYLDYLSKTNPSSWSVNKEKAFWMNAYNAYTIKVILDYYPLKSIMDIKKNGKGAWDIPFAKVGGKAYTLNAIEHEILRPKFKDARVHAGINCASYSCPPILNEAFTASNVDVLLNKAFIGFVNDPKRNKIQKNSIQLSKLFEWFKDDFTQSGNVNLIDFLNKYSKIKISKTAKITYLDYNWSLNKVQ